MTQNQTVNDWELPTEFLDSKIYLNYDIPTYEFKEGTIKPFFFQTDVPQETAEEKNEQNKAIQDQVKLGIIKIQYAQPLQQQSDNLSTTFHPELRVTVSPTKITMLNGKKISITQPSVQPSIQNQIPNLMAEFSNKNQIPQYNSNLFGNNKKVGKNDPCTCGSGKKYKICHGR